MSLKEIQHEAEVIAENYPFSSGGVYLDAVDGWERPDFIGGNCLEHAERLAAVIGGRTVITTNGRSHVACLVDSDEKTHILDTSVRLTEPCDIRRCYVAELPFHSWKTPAWYKGSGVHDGIAKFKARQSYYPHGFFTSYEIDLNNQPDDLLEVIKGIERLNFYLVGGDENGLVQLQIGANDRRIIYGREGTSDGPFSRTGNNVKPLITRMAACLLVTDSEIVDVLNDFVDAYKEFRKLSTSS